MLQGHVGIGGRGHEHPSARCGKPSKPSSSGWSLLVCRRCSTAAETAVVQPGSRSKGRRVFRLIVPVMPALSRFAVGDLMTSAPENNCEGYVTEIGLHAHDRAAGQECLAVEQRANLRQTANVDRGAFATLAIDLHAGDSLQRVRDGPVRAACRCLRRQMLSWIDTASRLSSTDCCSEARTPVTTTSSRTGGLVRGRRRLGIEPSRRQQQTMAVLIDLVCGHLTSPSRANWAMACSTLPSAIYPSRDRGDSGSRRTCR